MSSPVQDSKGYYRTLGLAPGASADAIKKAYRIQAKELHPDRNKSQDARDKFAKLTEAYGVLRDAVHRAEYDATGMPPLQQDGEDYPTHPFVCSCCGQVTAQPRFVKFERVASNLIWAKTHSVEGIFCRDCADKQAVRASLATWAQGFWSLPGLIRAPLALWRNLWGGKKPALENARLLIRQSRAFLAWDDVNIARSLALQAKTYARSHVHKRQVEDMLQRTAGANKKLRNRWSLFSNGVFFAQALPLVTLPLLVGLVGIVSLRPWEQSSFTRAEILVQPPQVGDFRFVAVDDLKLRVEPKATAPVLAFLDRFMTVEVLGFEGDWSEVQGAQKISGWVPTSALYAGSAAQSRQEWCEANRGLPPQSGEVLVRRASGDNRLLVHNESRNDAFVKLKTVKGVTVLTVFVPATHTVALSGIPEGGFRAEFATGKHFSRACGLFLEGQQAYVMPWQLTFRHVSTVRANSVKNLPEMTIPADPNASSGPSILESSRFEADQ